MTGPSTPSPDAWAGLGGGEALLISVSIVTRGRIGTHFVGTAEVSVDMADG